MSLVHLTGDASLLRGPIRPGSADAWARSTAGCRDEDKAAVRALALDALRAYRDRGCTLPPPPSRDDDPRDDELHRRRGGARRVRADDARGDGARRRDARDVALGRRAGERRAALPRRRHRRRHVGSARRDPPRGGGHPVRRRREERRRRRHVAREHAIPGCRVDVANHFYCYSFAPNHDWPEFFSQRDELRDYFERCADRLRRARQHPLRHRGRERALGRGDARAGTSDVRTRRRRRGDARRPTRSSAPSASSTGRSCRTSRAASRSRARASTRPRGSTSTTSRASASP